MDRALAGIPGTFPCADDVKVQGSTEEQHDIDLLETVSHAQSAGIKFNPDKCSIKKQQIEDFGRVISTKGIKPCPKKVQAFLNMSPPANKQELQSFLGSVNSMSNFTSNLAQKTHIMRSLLKKDVHYVWTPDMEKDFVAIQQAIADVTVLIHFDPNKPVTIETDAYLKGLGLCYFKKESPSDSFTNL